MIFVADTFLNCTMSAGRGKDLFVSVTVAGQTVRVRPTMRSRNVLMSCFSF